MQTRRETLRNLVIAGLLMPALPALAQNAAAPAAPAAGEGDPAVATVRRMTDALEAALKAADVRARAETLAGPMKENFDLPEMLRLGVGTRWKEIPADKQQALVAAFEPYLAATYATRLGAASGSTFAIDPKSEPRGKGRIVHVTVTDGSGDTSPVDYVLNADNKITDVFLQGTVSEAGTLRTGFTEPLQEGGADALLAHLKKSTETMLAAPAPKAK
ncbi:MlaC/ttg2D family ABC transporter substrate-binding protein [Methylobacterium sp. SyP6R]|uniref:MlaC/ttg2D family ABC transporter substrate-binding protein n=1 Tax=Methylobacterium sp. SyP6R TaxID=2718876 RepID=UPI001F468B5D|nr:ABC transporter substrate-binding protein [Methylobacterium sp. SyP6R]MCF4127035.1 ABC transporter substrate-binding protein [Methylobacterium sp. SyP6R]